MNSTRDSTPRAERSAAGLSNERPAAMKVERRIRCDDGEYEAPATPDRFVFRQNVVGRTAKNIRACIAGRKSVWTYKVGEVGERVHSYL